MIEFSEDFSTKYTGKLAVSQTAQARLNLRYGEIPYTSAGLMASLFTFNRSSLEDSIIQELSDLSPSVLLSGDRVIVGDISVTLPEE